MVGSHSLHYVMALDGGDPANEVAYRDALYSWEAPFKKGTATELLKTIDRFGGVTYGDEDTAIAYDYWWNTRNQPFLLGRDILIGDSFRL